MSLIQSLKYLPKYAPPNVVKNQVLPYFQWKLGKSRDLQ